MSIQVTKADGSTEVFRVEKLRRSLRRSGATPTEVTEIVKDVEARLYDGIRTQQIYRYAFELLRSTEKTAATRYSMRRALFSLGPTGFPFERFLARLFEREGYVVETGVFLQGKCAEHEIDVAAYKTNHSLVAEAKFHSRPGVKSDLQVAMYSYARLLDLTGQRICTEDVCGIKDFFLITNTKFTTTAEKYAACVGLHILSWDYPRRDNLHDRIQRTGIYPITVLQTLHRRDVATLLEHDIIVCRDIIGKNSILRQLHYSDGEINAVMAEARAMIALKEST